MSASQATALDRHESRPDGPGIIDVATAAWDLGLTCRVGNA
jgi:hypothetical protein